MELPIPIITNLGNKFNEVEIIKPKASVIADVKKIADTGEIFQSIKVFLGGCIELISGEENSITVKADIKNMIGMMPYRSAEVCLYKILVLYDPDKDAVEGIYTCPRCGFQLITEFNEDIDTRDYISELNIMYIDQYTDIELELTEPVNIKDKGKDEILESVESMTLRHPTISDCIIAEKKYGATDAIRMQFAMYSEALKQINGKEVDKKYRNTYGVYIFENIKDAKKDLGELNRQISQYGIDPNLTKVCRNCSKEFKVPINMSNFFVSGLTL